MTGAPSPSHHLRSDDQAFENLDELPPPSYEAARAAGAAPPPRSSQLPPTTTTATTIANPQPANPQPLPSTHDDSIATVNGPPYAPPPETLVRGEGAPAWGVTGGNAIALQPLAQSPMSVHDHQVQSQAQAQAASNSTIRLNNRPVKVVPLHLMDEKPEWVDCQFCKERVQTRVIKKGKGFQCLTGTAFCVVCICLTPLPCCLHWFEQAKWFCTSCEKQIAVRVRDGEIIVFPAPEEQMVSSQHTTSGRMQQDSVLAEGRRQQNEQQPAPMTTTTPQEQQQPPIMISPRHSPVSSPPLHSQLDPTPRLPAQAQFLTTPQIQTENAQQTPEPRAQEPPSPQQHPAPIAFDRDRPPGAPPLKF